ncbi:ComEC/Rec2 family competence protein [Anaerobacillus sp. HL2]|nr:ComEC/Rec2 family competence protein [Anaerobacillus sp. HL2]
MLSYFDNEFSSFVFHLGFQLSFLVSYSLIISANTLIHQYRNWVTQLFAVTIIAQCISFPIIIYHFYEFSLFEHPFKSCLYPICHFFHVAVFFHNLY